MFSLEIIWQPSRPHLTVEKLSKCKLGVTGVALTIEVTSMC